MSRLSEARAKRNDTNTSSGSAETSLARRRRERMEARQPGVSDRVLTDEEAKATYKRNMADLTNAIASGNNSIPSVGEQGLESSAVDPLAMLLEGALAKPIMAKVMKMWSQRGIPEAVKVAIKTGDKEALARYINTNKEVKALGLGDEVVTGGKSLGGNLLKEQRHANEVMTPLSKRVRERAEEVLPHDEGLNVTVATRAKELDNASYANAEKMYDDVDGLVSTNLYDISKVRERILAKMKEDGVDPEVFSEMKRSLSYGGRNLSPVQDEASRQLTGTMTKLNQGKAKLKAEENTLDTTQKRIEDIQGEQTRLQKAIDNGTAQESALIKLADNTDLLSKLEPALKSAKSDVSRSKLSIDRTSKTAEGYRAQLPDDKWVGEKEYMRMIKRVNRKIRDTPSTHQGVKNSYKDAKGMIEEDFLNLTKSQNPEVHKAFKDAQSNYKQHIDTFGRDSSLGKLSNGNIDEEMSSMFSNPNKVMSAVQALLDKGEPELARKLSQQYLTNRVGTLREGTQSVYAPKGIDYAGTSTKLDEVLNNPETKQFFTKVLGKDKMQDVDGLFNTLRGVGEVEKNVGTLGPLNNGMFAGVNGARPTLSRALKLVKDKVGIVASDATNAVVDKGRKVLKLPESNRGTQIIDRMEDMAKGIQPKADLSGKPTPTGVALNYGTSQATASDTVEEEDSMLSTIGAFFKSRF